MNGKYHAILDRDHNLVRRNFPSPIVNTSWPAFKTHLAHRTMQRLVIQII